MNHPLTPRQEAEAIEQFGHDLAKLISDLDALCKRMSPNGVILINEVPNQDKLGLVAETFRAIGSRLSRELDCAEEAEDRRRDNPLEPDFRRLGQ